MAQRCASASRAGGVFYERNAIAAMPKPVKVASRTPSLLRAAEDAMSFDVFFDSFRDGESVDIDPSIIEDAWGPYVVSREPTCWVLRFPDGGLTELYGRIADPLSHFMIARPPAHPAFWMGMLVILEKTLGVIHWPGGGPVVGDPAAIGHLPADLIKALGQPIVVNQPGDILEAISRS
jgi:hypothetical protein